MLHTSDARLIQLRERIRDGIAHNGAWAARVRSMAAASLAYQVKPDGASMPAH